MRKLTALLLAVGLCLTLTGCKSDKVKEVEALIDAIGTVTVDSEADIIAAEKAFAALSQEDMGWIRSYDVLEAARQSYEPLYTPVKITPLNWEEYFELVIEEQWREDMSGNATQLRSQCIFRLKPEYVDKVNPKETALQLHVGITGQARISTIDWEQRTFTEGELYDTLRAGSASYDWPTYRFDPNTPAPTSINIGYSHLSNPKTDDAETKIFHFTHEITAIDGTISILQ